MSQYSNSSFTEDTNSSWFKVFSYIKPKSKVLDVGCSSGNFGEVLIEKKDCIVDGIELDKNDYREAKIKLRKVFKLNIETDDLSVVNDKYDYIYFGDVIEHLVDPIKSLERVKKFLNPDGCLVFSIPNMSHISVRLMLLNGNLIYGETGLLDKTHLHFYTHNEVQRVFSGAGYVISKIDPVLIDYPKELIERQLNSVGLKYTKAFINFAATTEASVYQFVGIAKPKTNASQKSQKLNMVSPVDLFQIYLDDTRVYYEKQIDSQSKHIDKLGKQLNESNRVRDEYLNELNTIKNSRSYQLTNKFRSVTKKKS